MHIMEGYLPPEWCAVWFVISIPIMFFGAKKILSILREYPEEKMNVALSGAFVFLLSSLKLPSVTGSSSHPTGTCLSVALYGIACTSFLATIVLLFQAMLLAHGGLTTLGANVFSMGIAGPALAFAIWRIFRTKTNISIPVVIFITAVVADLFTYVVTATQLTLAFGSGGYLQAFTEFMSIFAVTQIPLAIIEGIVFTMFAKYLLSAKPQIFGMGDEQSNAEGRYYE